VTVEKQNNDLEMKFTLREIIEAANDAKIVSVYEVVEAILKRSVSPERAKELVDSLVPPDSTGWQEGSWIPGSKKQVQRGFVG